MPYDCGMKISQANSQSYQLSAISYQTSSERASLRLDQGELNADG